MHGIKRLLKVRAILVVCAWLMAITATGCGAGTTTDRRLDDTIVESAIVATQSGEFQAPLNSTPDADATTIYFTATVHRGRRSFATPAAGGAATPLAAGAPLVASLGIAISSDSRQLYIADPQAGQIFVLPVDGGAPSALRGTEATMRGMDVVSEGGRICSISQAERQAMGSPPSLKRPTTGDATLTLIVKGAPLVDPDGIARTQAGVLFVADSVRGGRRVRGGICKIEVQL